MTTQPSVAGAAQEPASSSRASVTDAIFANLAWARVPEMTRTATYEIEGGACGASLDLSGHGLGKPRPA